MKASTIGTILKENGYATSWFGKEHNTPSYQSSQAGPFRPLAEWAWASSTSTASSVATPASGSRTCIRNTTAIYPFLGKPGWNMDHGDGQ